MVWSGALSTHWWIDVWNCSCQELWDQIWHWNVASILRKGEIGCSCSRNKSGQKWGSISLQQSLLKHFLALTRVFYHLEDCKSDDDGCHYVCQLADWTPGPTQASIVFKMFWSTAQCKSHPIPLGPQALSQSFAAWNSMAASSNCLDVAMPPAPAMV